MTSDTPADAHWSPAHDLALIFIALAYGTDAELSATEIQSVTDAVASWRPDDDLQTVQETVVEALAVFDHDSGGDEVLQSINRLGDRLEPASRRRALEDAMRVAEADGLLLTSERTLISLLAASWDLKAVEEELLAASEAELDDRPVWTLLHDVALLALAIAHGSTGSLLPEELEAIMVRLAGWRVDLDGDDLRSILTVTIEVYKAGELSEELTRSASSIRERLPNSLRLIVLNDLIAVAESDAPMNAHERDMIGSLAQAWQLGVRVEA